MCPICHEIGHFLNSPSRFFSFSFPGIRNFVVLCLPAGYQNSHLKRPIQVYAIIFHFSVSNKKLKIESNLKATQGSFQTVEKRYDRAFTYFTAVYRWHSVNVRVSIKEIFLTGYNASLSKTLTEFPEAELDLSSSLFVRTYDRYSCLHIKERMEWVTKRTEMHCEWLHQTGAWRYIMHVRIQHSAAQDELYYCTTSEIDKLRLVGQRHFHCF